VLQSVAAPGPTIKFVDQVVRYAPGDVNFIYFSWRNALFGAFDALHVHWPEYFTRGSSRLATTVKRVLFRGLLRRLRRRGIPVVRTMHNIQPHAAGDARERDLLARLDRLTVVDVHLSECTPPRDIRTVVIPHGDYRDQFSGHPKYAAVPGRLLFVGRIEAYKGVLELIEIVQEMPPERVELRVVGRATGEMTERIRAAAARMQGGPSVSLRLEFVSDEAMVEEVTRAQLVVLPYREMHNSGILLVALSLGRPVLVPSSCVNDAIAREVGDHWVTTYDGSLTADDIERALEGLANHQQTVPSFRDRDWATVAASYAAVYREAVAVASTPGA
jgi:beta-1,4-mannosyltransferase